MENGTRIYYTLDGTIPDENSTLYNENLGISLDEEGDYILKYIAYNAKGIPSDIGTESYTIAFKEPNAPRITPASGQYEYARTIQVFVPSGCTAYYAFDETVTTNSTKYTGPIQMPSGEHIFSGIVHSMFGYENIGFHLADDYVTLDFSGPLTLQDVEKVEEKANELIYRNIDVVELYPDKKQLETIDFRSKK